MQTIENTVKLTNHQAAAVRAVITEINQLAPILQAKQLEFKRLTDMIQADADLDPRAYTIDSVEDIAGVPHLKLRPIRPTEPAQK